MAFSFKDMQTASDMIAERGAGADAERVALWMRDNEPATLRKLLSGKCTDLSGAFRACGLKYTPHKVEPKEKRVINHDRTEVPPEFAVDVESGRVISAETVEALEYGELPADICEIIDSYLLAFCQRFNIEDMRKASAQQWQAFCIVTGQSFKRTKLLHDIRRERERGGMILDPYKVVQLLPIWAGYCGAFDKAPLVCDFCYFCGTSQAWLYECSPDGAVVTSSLIELRKKLEKMQESGLSAVLVDGRRNPTGSIFFLKNCHGWRDQREVHHTAEILPQKADGLPQFED